MLKILYAGYLNLSLVISAPCTLEICSAAKNFKNTKSSYVLGRG